ncbi:MAG: hypothetical protein L0Z68_01145 [Gammaproteobacteria bacterium]|nr:hypothetical protein [Gammaproteobacteria bacterium]
MRLRIILALLALILAVPAHGVTIILGNRTPARIIIRVGSPGGTINLVSFVVPAANVGDGTEIMNATPILVSVEFRAAPANSRTATLTANSSTPLNNGAGGTIPFTEIRWNASDPDIPSGQFTGGVQTLMSFLNNRQIFNDHTFFYRNTQVYASGTYTGRVTYTLSVP